MGLTLLGRSVRTSGWEFGASSPMISVRTAGRVLRLLPGVLFTSAPENVTATRWISARVPSLSEAKSTSATSVFPQDFTLA